MGQSSPRAAAPIDSIAAVKIIVAVDTFFLLLGVVLTTNPPIVLVILILLKLTGSPRHTCESRYPVVWRVSGFPLSRE